MAKNYNSDNMKLKLGKLALCTTLCLGTAAFTGCDGIKGARDWDKISFVEEGKQLYFLWLIKGDDDMLKTGYFIEEDNSLYFLDLDPDNKINLSYLTDISDTKIYIKRVADVLDLELLLDSTFSFSSIERYYTAFDNHNEWVFTNGSLTYHIDDFIQLEKDTIKNDIDSILEQTNYSPDEKTKTK